MSISTPRSVRLAAAVVVLLLVLAAAANGQVSVEECTAHNGPRYDTPGDAAAAQYIGTAGRCRDAAEPDSDVAITPIGGAGRGSGGSSSAPPAAPAPTRAGATPAAPTQPPASAAAPAQPRQTVPEPSPVPDASAAATATAPADPASRPAREAAPTDRAASPTPSSAVVQRALAAADAPGGPSLPGASAMPAEVLVALLAAAALGGLGLILRLAGRR